MVMTMGIRLVMSLHDRRDLRERLLEARDRRRELDGALECEAARRKS
jgi:hypothetical protein